MFRVQIHDPKPDPPFPHPRPRPQNADPNLNNAEDAEVWETILRILLNFLVIAVAFFVGYKLCALVMEGF
ncbi:hypothetical protein Hypma_005883 [Hypsizygus marmoreus]|uniref:Uncharacterized protein n=1 Tax=Hypsizygus marmoreus TaxID=39966 RepID=A0A369KIH3_HYPMA|nr:hypothetical protein Hypma_005883 [Hypsizygus marmoreus]